MQSVSVSHRYPLMAKRLCSNCGLCNHPQYETQVEDICAFHEDKTAAQEITIHGRERSLQNDEAWFGVTQQMYAARLKRPEPKGQTGGSVLTILTRLLETQQVDAVLVSRRNPDNSATPVLIRDPADLQQCAGSRWDMVPLLDVIPDIQELGIKRLAVVGVGCQISALRAIEAQLGLDKLFVIGLICTDNMTQPNWQKFIKATSRNPRTVRKLEFMPDFRVWFWHEDGSIEKVLFFELRLDKLEDVFPGACLACFDQINGLADLTVGYMAAPVGWQWFLVRNDRGAALFDLIRKDLEFTAFVDSGDRIDAMKRLLKYLGKPPLVLPRLLARLIDLQIQQFGPKGLEFARLVIEQKQTRNWHQLKTTAPDVLKKLLPKHGQKILDRFNLK
jgi:3,8-divinyl protochlorophyllide a 8-vinyl-reductase (ferredoxin)